MDSGCLNPSNVAFPSASNDIIFAWQFFCLLLLVDFGLPSLGLATNLLSDDTLFKEQLCEGKVEKNNK